MSIFNPPLLLGTKVVNLWGPPGSGKSTTAAGLFNLMKNKGARVELVMEEAKTATYAGNTALLQNQLAMLGLQDQRQRILVGKVDWIITDSPLPLGIVYSTPEYADILDDMAYMAYDRYDNVDFYIDREKPYAPYGRAQSEAEALALEVPVLDVYRTALHGRKEVHIKGNSLAEWYIGKELGQWP